MDLRVHHVDAFADRAFAGNPAAVCPLDRWIDDDLMQSIAAEITLSDMAFFVPLPDKGPGHYHLRWFTPTDEVDLCGHATLASSHILLNELAPDLGAVTFHTRSGPLTVTRGAEGALAMDFPALPPHDVPDADEIMDHLGEALGRRPVALLKAVNALAVFEHEDDVRRLRYASHLRDVLLEADSWGLIVTAPVEGQAYDFVSRFFAPLKGIPEDPVTGSAHCTLAPYWAARLGKTDLTGFQVSKRGGQVGCRYDAHGARDRVVLSGRCVSFMRGTITL